MRLIDEAFRKFNRQAFVPPEYRDAAQLDTALPIGHGQTISQPTVVSRMLEWLDTQPGDSVLDVGSGSGWTAALLSHIVGPKGSVYAVERIRELRDFGESNARKAGVRNARFFLAGSETGLPEHAPYDRILVSASAEEIPKSLLKQLKTVGKMVIPIKNDIIELTKTGEHVYDIKNHYGFVFVPLL